MEKAYQNILYASDGKIVQITLNRPDKRNALNDAVLEELIDAFEAADREASARCVILTGAGDKAFSSGADLGGFGGEGLYAQYEARGRFPRLFLTMERLKKPILAGVNGTCIAGGFGLMLACDLAIAKSGVKLGTPEIARGLFPYMISALILRSVPRRRAHEIMFLGETFSAEQAEAWNVINRAVPAEEYQACLEAWAQKLASYSPAVLGLGRRALNQQAGMPLDGALSYLSGLLILNASMEDAAEGITAFFEKREPDWKGK